MTAQAILRLLISEHGVALRLPAGDNQIAAHIAQETGLAQGTLLGILNGGTARINENTRRKLADLFNRVAVPQIQPVWLSSRSIAEFNVQRAQSSVIPLTMPTDYRSTAAALQNWLCGAHIAYRYSLDFIDTGDVAREVVYIWNNDSVLQFRMSFVNPSGGDIGPVHYYEGPVLLVGRTAVLIGMNVEPKTAQREYDRARIIFIDHDNGGGDTHDCKIGLMTSTRQRRDHVPRRAGRAQHGAHRRPVTRVDRAVVAGGEAGRADRRVERPDPDLGERGLGSDQDHRNPEEVGRDVAAVAVVGRVLDHQFGGFAHGVISFDSVESFPMKLMLVQHTGA